VSDSRVGDVKRLLFCAARGVWGEAMSEERLELL
jgi:hypothetical protein